MPWWLRQFVEFINWLAAQATGRKYEAIARQIGHATTGPSENPSQRRFVAIQIDGLAHEHLQRAMALGYTPTLQRLVAQGYRLQRWRCGLPSSTPSVQAGIMYGNNWDIPAFRWYEKSTGAALMCKMPRHVERIKSRIAEGRSGILKGGSSYTNMLDGDARLALFTLSAMGRQRFFEHLRGLGWALLFVLIPWRILSTLGRALWELLREWGRTLGRWIRSGFRHRLTLGKPVLQVLTNIVFGEIQTFAVLLDVYRGMPAIYVNYYGYDEIAHQDGPLGGEALRALKRIDRHIRRIDSVRRKYWPDMDLYVLSDHGMTRTITFRSLVDKPLGEFIAEHVKATVAWEEPLATGRWDDREANFLLDELAGIEAHLSQRGQRLTKILRRWIADKVPPSENAEWDLARGSDVVVRSSGSLAHIYFNVTKERMDVSEIAILYPELLDVLGDVEAIGLVLGLDDGRPVVITNRGTATLTTEWLPPGLSEPEQSVVDLARLVSFPHSGDLVLLGAWDGRDEVVTFEEQIATHGGTGGPQEYPFFITPPDAPLDLSSVTNSRQLYPYFMRRYHGQEVTAAEP